MKKLYLAVALAACSLMSPVVQAQPGGGKPGGPGRPGGGPGRPGGGPGGPGGMRGMRGMRNNPKMRLSGFLRGISHLESGKTNALSSSQAKAVVNAVTPWTKKSRMSEAEAKALMTRLNGILTAKQKSELEKGAGRRFGGERRGQGGGPGGEGRRGDWGGRPGGDRPGGGRPGGPGGPGGPPSGAQMEKMRNFMQNYNPLYPPTKYSELKQLPERMREGFTRRYKAQQETLNALSRKARSGH